MIPFPDDQPVVYPDAAAWEELTDTPQEIHGSPI